MQIPLGTAENSSCHTNNLYTVLRSWLGRVLFLQVQAVAAVGAWAAVWAHYNTWWSSRHLPATSLQRQQQTLPITSHLCRVASWEGTTASADLPHCLANPCSSFCLMATATPAVETARGTLIQSFSRDCSTLFQHVTPLFTQVQGSMMCSMLLVILHVSWGASMSASVCLVQKMPFV